jgi:hypothetical protein
MELNISAEDAALLDRQRGDLSISEYLHLLIRAVLLVKLPGNNGDGDGARELAELIKDKDWVINFLRILAEEKSKNEEPSD